LHLFIEEGCFSILRSISTTMMQTEEAAPSFEDEVEIEDLEEIDQPDPSLYKLIKRVPEHPPVKKDDIYVSRTMNITVLKKRVLKLLEKSEMEYVTLNGLGAAMNVTITLAQQLQEDYNGKLELACSTSSVKLVDEYQPLRDDLKPIIQTRYNSSIHIKIRKI